MTSARSGPPVVVASAAASAPGRAAPPHHQQQPQHQHQQQQHLLSPIERDILDEYALLLSNLHELAALLSSLSASPTTAVLDGLRVLERKTSLVSTLLKASVYSIVLQQQMVEGNG